MKVLYQKLSITSLFIGIIFSFLSFVGIQNIYAEPSSCGSYAGNIPQHMAVSCNVNNISGKVILNKIAPDKLSASGTATVNVNIQNIPLFKFFDSVSSLGVTANLGQNTKFGIPYQAYGYMLEKLNFNPYINYNASSNMNGVGALNLPSSCGTPSGVICNISSNNGGEYGYFAVPGIGKAADLFTLGNIFSIQSPYNININSLPNNEIITKTPNSLIGSCSGHSYCMKNKQPLDYKLTTPYGNPYNLNQKKNGTTIYAQMSIFGGIVKFFKNLFNTFVGILNSINPFAPSRSNPIIAFSTVSKNKACSQYISQLNSAATENPPSSSNACIQGKPTAPSNSGTEAFQIQTSFSCVSEYNNYQVAKETMQADQSSGGTALNNAINAFNAANAALQKCMNTLTIYETSGVPVSFSLNLYLQGINRILADFWYMEAMMNGGAPIGHTNLESWKSDVNKKTFFLNQPISAQSRVNLYKGMGISVPTTITINGKGSPHNYYFPWLGDAIQIAQNLSVHHFQPYYPNTTSTLPEYPKLAPGEYYIKDPSKHPDPLLLYLIYTGALSPNDPVVRNALGSYNVSNITSSANNQGYNASGNITNTSGVFNQQACNSALTMSPPSTPNFSINQLLSYANDFLGANYSMNRDFSQCFPNTSPGGPQGIDCSSFVATVYKDMGIPLSQDTTTETQYSLSQPALKTFTNIANVKHGDLIYFWEANDPQGAPQHVGLIKTWAGGGNFSDIEATYPGNGVVNVNYTNEPFCLTPPGGIVTPTSSSSCIMGFAQPALGSFN